MNKARVVNWIVKINVAIFLLWFVFLMTDPSFMMKNFLVSWAGIVQGSFWTILTSVFSHNMFFHLFINMYFFYGFGRALELTMGSKQFLSLYLVCGVAGSLGHSLVSAFILHQPELSALGASGAISGVVVYFSIKFPKEKVYLLGFLPLPAFFAIFLVVGLDIWGLVAQTKGSQLPIGYGAHLGGALAGGLCYLISRIRSFPFS